MNLKPITRNLRSDSGFTLIEAVVATAVFAFVVTSILGVYISTIQLDRKSRAQRAVAQDARFIMEFLAKEVRNGTINYPSYASSTVSGTSDLYIQNQANVVEHFFLSGTNMLINKGGANANMNSSGTKVTNLLFYIQPTTDPYTPAKSANDQPHVTVVLDLQSNYGTAAKDTVTMSLQDSFATRQYPLRVFGAGYTTPLYTTPTYPTPASGFATGGAVSTSGSNTVRTFSTSDTLTVFSAGTIQYLIVAGGGGGGQADGAGGGAGGVITGQMSIAAGTYPIIVGGGGTGATGSCLISGDTGSSGSNSSFHGLTAIAGGGGGSYGTSGLNGGSGGGGGAGNGAATAGLGTPNQGHDGMNSNNPPFGGGGGGATAVGGGWTAAAGIGGAGIPSDITGATVYYGGGGGGGANSANGSGGTGGVGGGGTGGTGGGGGNGINGTGGGGGGGGRINTVPNPTCSGGGTGGNGVVLIRYLTNPDITPPVVTAFDVQPKFTSGAVTATFTTTDSGGSHLKDAELWRATARSNCTTTDDSGCNDWAAVESEVAVSDVVWTSLVNTTATGNTLTKTGGAVGTNDAGAVSTRTIDSGDGYVEFTYNGSGFGGFVDGGLSNGNTDQSVADIDFGIKLQQSNFFYAEENGVPKGSAGSYVVGDVFRIAVVGGVVQYSRNGTVFYTSVQSPTYPLLFDTSIKELNSSIANAKIASTVSDSWTGNLTDTPPANIAEVYGLRVHDNAGNTGFQQTKIMVGEVTPPVVTAFDVQPRTTSGSVTATFTATDSGGSHLKNAELWRATARTNCTISDNSGCNDWAVAANTTIPANNVVWTSAVNATATGNTLTKTGGTDGTYDAGAVSTQTIGTDGGYVEFTYASGTGLMAGGLSNGNTDQSDADIDFGIKLQQSSFFYVYEKGVQKGSTGTYAVGDVFRIAVVGGVVQYSRNGTVFYTSVQSPTYPLLFDTSIGGSNNSISNAKIYYPSLDSWSGTMTDTPPTDTSYIYGVHVYDYSGNFGLEPAKIFVSSTSYGVTTSGFYTVYTFTISGTFTVASPQSVQVLVVGGGGGGSGSASGGGGGGGGAGGYNYNANYSVTPGSYSVTVGAGGAGGVANVRANAPNGSNSSFGTITSIGGGGGNGWTDPKASNGGSGGGAEWGDTVGLGTAGQGNNGGLASTTAPASGGGGGGGAGAVGGAGSSTNGGNGGIGLANSITGTSVYYAGGGGGGSTNAAGSASAGGLGGGGVGGKVSAGSPGTAGTGGGGGSGSNGLAGGAGGSGIVIISFLTTPDTTLPVVSAFDVQPRTASSSVTATFTATDSGGSHLQKANLMRAVYDASTCTTTVNTGCVWSVASTITAPAAADTWNAGSSPPAMFSEIPPAASYIYGIQVYDNAGNFGLEPAKIKVDAFGLSASGGTITTSGGVTTATFTTSGTFTVSGSGTIDYLVVGGGGAGGAGGGVGGGGGGAGGVFSGSMAVTAQAYPITIGAGGAGGGAAVGPKGSNTVFGAITALGGGGGGNYCNNATNGASGGGGSYNCTAGTGTAGQGHDGGAGSTDSPYGGGGGGGVSGSGGAGSNTNGGAGGAGIASSITGSPVFYGGGGGGSISSGPPGPGGSGGGGAGGSGASNGTNATPNTGGGGGSGSGAGGSGVVIIRYISPVVEGIAPVVSAFDVQPRSGSNLATATFTATDAGGSHLQKADLWRAPYDASVCNPAGSTAGCNFGASPVDSVNAPPASDGPWNGTLHDYAVGSLVYGLHVYDNSGNTGFEPAKIKVDGHAAFATGGTITTSGIYAIHTFTSSGTFTVIGSSPASVDYLVIGGGGAGGGAGNPGGGGGGAGGMRNGSLAVSPQSYTVTIGGGGASVGANGSNSVFGSITALGGGGGGTYGSAAASGGSGGGGSYTYSVGNGTSGQGNNGGSGTTNSPYGAGGGGGAGAVGGAGSASVGGTGGAGASSTISGATVFYAGGGGGNVSSGTSGPGGAGGGGAGGLGGAGTNGTANTGGGGGGGSGSGGSGIVIIRYLIPVLEATPPVVSAFDVQPRNGSNAVTATFTATDAGGSHLLKADLWKAVYDVSNCNPAGSTAGCNFGATPVNSVNAPAGSDGPWSSSMLDNAAGSVVYGLHVYDNSGNTGFEPAKIRVDAPAAFATGGTITSSGFNEIHTFTSSGTFTPSGSGSIQYLIVGGGGAGGSGSGGTGGGGGGGGGVQTGTLAVTAQPYTVTIGGGGAGGASSGANGSNSVFASITATGGGGGATYGVAPGNGGSGGGGDYNGVAGTGTSGQGNNGGLGSTTSTYGGGGGGGGGTAGGAGSATVGGTGGAGFSSSISGSAIFYAGGGGGGIVSGTPGLGGGGGGGAGGAAGNGTSATPNTGGGGGAGGSSSGLGAAGGSGIVIIRYNPSPSAFLLTSGSSWTVPAGVTSIQTWAIGGGGGAGGAGPADASTGSGGGAGGVAYSAFTVSPGATVSYSLGSAGTGGSGCAGGSTGTAGGNTTVTVGGVTITGNGGGAGGCNTGVGGTGGSFSPSGAAGAAGQGVTGEGGGGYGGAIGGGIGTAGGNAGSTGGQAVDVSGSNAVISAAGFSTSSPGVGGGTASTPANAVNGTSATGVGAGGGGAGWYGGTGGNGLYGGGGAGAAGYQTSTTGGAGGAGAVLITFP